MSINSISFEQLLAMFRPEYKAAIQAAREMALLARQLWQEEIWAGSAEILLKQAFGVKEVLLAADGKVQDKGIGLMIDDNPDLRFIAEERTLDSRLKSHLIPLDKLDKHPGKAWVVDPVDGSIMFGIGSASWAVSLGKLINGDVDFGITFMPAVGMGRVCVSDPKEHKIRVLACNDLDCRMLEPLPVRLGPHADKPILKTGYRMPSRPAFQKFFQAMDSTAIRIPSGPTSIGLTEVAVGLIDGFVEDRVKLVDIVGGLSHVMAAGKRLQIYTRSESGERWKLDKLTPDCMTAKTTCLMVGNDRGMEALETLWTKNV